MRPPRTPPDTASLIPELIGSRWSLVRAAKPALPDGRYLPWDELRYRSPPAGFAVEEWWATIRWARQQASTPVRAMQDVYGMGFSFVPLAGIQSDLFALDRTNVARDVLMALGNEDIVAEYRISQIIEEAISSSVIEGARPTTREMARQMVRERRPPASRDERMILNNWRAMQRILELRDEKRPMTLEDLLELHRILGDGALDVPGSEGVLRTVDHAVTVIDVEGTVWHTPPDADGIVDRVEALLAFANDTTPDHEAFIHPIVRAILVHFWIGFEHPFRDGNGRIARALFYWCMLRHGYEMAEFLSISGPIDRSPKGYYMAFAHTEADAGDLTYFVLHQLGVLREALRDLTAHLEQRARNMRDAARKIAEFADLNHRQRALLQHAIRHPLESYTIVSHAASHAVHYQTARLDLIDLVQRGFLEEWRATGSKRFRPTAKLRSSSV